MSSSSTPTAAPSRNDTIQQALATARAGLVNYSAALRKVTGEREQLTARVGELSAQLADSDTLRAQAVQERDELARQHQANLEQLTAAEARIDDLTAQAQHAGAELTAARQTIDNLADRVAELEANQVGDDTQAAAEALLALMNKRPSTPTPTPAPAGDAQGE